MTRSARALALSVALLVGGGARAAEEASHGRPLEDLHYGDVLFHYFAGQDFEGATRLMAAREQGRAQGYAEEGDLILGSMLLSLGQYEQAYATLRRVLSTSTDIAQRDRAWFYVGRVAYEHDAPEKTLAALAEIVGPLQPELDAEASLLAAQALMKLGRFDDAAARLSSFAGPEQWSRFARYNLGVALVRAGRTDEGERLLDEVGDAGAGTEEQRALIDRANVALAYSRLQRDDYAAARTVLQRVRLEGPYSNKALLGLGWAELGLEHYSEALVPWMELRHRDLLDPAVQESLLAVPYAIVQLGSYSEAARRYESAIESYDAETRRLDEMIQRVNDGDLLDELLSDDDSARMLGERWTLDRPPATVETHYLYRLMASERFQQSLRSYRNLVVLKDNLRRWSASLDAFADIVGVQRRIAADDLPQARGRVQALQLDALLARQQALDERYRQLASRNYPVDAEPARLDARQALADLHRATAKARRLKNAFEQPPAHAPAELDAFDERVVRQRARVDALSRSVERLLQRLRHYIQNEAAAELRQQRGRLQQYSAEARVALARIYDHSAFGAPMPPPASDVGPRRAREPDGRP